MAKELRDVIALEEQFAGANKNLKATAWLESLRSQINFGLKKGYLRSRLPGVPENPATPQSETEAPIVVGTFTEQEKEALVADGAILYMPTGETIRDQRKAGRKFWYVVNKTDRLIAFPSRKIEVAIYPDPERFFIPDSFDKPTDEQDALMEQDVQNLRQRLGLENIGMWRPEASEATGVVFKHFEVTGARLLGETFRGRANGYCPYIRTNTPTDKSGSHLANVGDFDAGNGPCVNDWLRNDHHDDLAVARWVVPMGDR